MSDNGLLDDPRYRPCDGCGAPVKPAAGYLGGPVKCLDCIEEAKNDAR